MNVLSLIPAFPIGEKEFVNICGTSAKPEVYPGRLPWNGD